MAGDGLVRKVPVVLGAIVVLLVVNTTLQYAAGPALRHALPLAAEGSRGLRVGSDRATIIEQHGPNHDLLKDVAPGGADAELLCVDRRPGCSSQSCSKVSEKYGECKATCNTCDHLRASIQAETGLQVRVVQQLSACADLHPSCAAWVKEDKCSREAKSMLELCQASCGFCQEQAISKLAHGGAGIVTTPGRRRHGALAALRAGLGGGGGDGDSFTAVLLDECQDDVSVCPYLAATGMCASGSVWVGTQCPRSCGKCTPSEPAAAGGGDSGGGDGGGGAGAVELTQQLVSGGASGDSQPAGAAGRGPTVAEAAAAMGAPKASPHRLYGSHDPWPGGPAEAQALQEWAVPGCHDYQPRCAAWAADGECDRNADYMAISCKASCANCKSYAVPRPFRVLQLNSGHAMPAVGLGTAGLGVGTAAAVQVALAAGYRLIDSAESPDWYSEPEVGAGLAAAKVPRESVFLTSKVHPRDLGRNATLAALKRSLSHLRTGYLDLLLLHYPACSPGTGCVPRPHQSWQESWRALEELVAAKLVRSIGVSNFGLSEMRELLRLAKVKPAVLQSRSDPFAVNHHLANLCHEANVTFVAYSSLGTQWINSPAAINPVFSNALLKARGAAARARAWPRRPACAPPRAQWQRGRRRPPDAAQEVAAAHPGKSVAQVVLRWALQRGQGVIPRSASAEHIRENLALFDFSLTDAEMAAISALDGTWKTGGLPLPVA
ncbi:XYL1 [Scenedesmus sp. PABB004]|nr:XYL1 [Scenedesmus sp. PABB004]